MLATPSATYLLAAAAALAVLPAPARADPAAAGAAACARAYQPRYRAPYALDAKAWDEHCKSGVQPDDILALGRQWCRDQLDAAQAADSGVSEAAWAEACRGGLDGRAPYEYLRAKRYERLLKLPADRLTVADGLFLAAQAASDPRPEVAAKMKEVQARLDVVVAAARDKLSGLSASHWAQVPLSAADGGYERLQSLFDLARRGQGTEAAVVAGGGARGPSGGDQRPLRPPQSMGGVDRGIDAPEKRLARLQDTLASMRLQTQERGRPAYDSRTLDSLETMLGAIDPKGGASDLVVLGDVEKAFGVYQRDASVIFKRSFESYGEADCSNDPRCTVTIRTHNDHDFPYARELLAGTMLHEALHVARHRAGGGANDFSDERAAGEAQYRLLSALRARREAEVAAAARELEQERARLTPAAYAEKERHLGLLKLSLATLAGERREILEDFERDPQKFAREFVARYYKEHFIPGAVTLEQQQATARELLKVAEKDHLQALAQEPAWRRRLGWSSDEVDAARRNVDSVRKHASRLAVDQTLDKDRAASNVLWRDGQGKKCGALLDADGDYRRASAEAAAALARLNDAQLDAALRARLTARLEAAEDRQSKIEERYAPCRVRR